MTNHIMQLEARVAALQAQVKTLEFGIGQLRVEALKEHMVCAYSVSEPARAEYAEHMSRRLEDLRSEGTAAYDNAELNELGPHAQDGNHFNCAHVRGCNCNFYHEKATSGWATMVYHAETCPVRATSWHCGECGAPLPKNLGTLAAVDMEMLKHWRATHRKVTNG